MDHHLGNLARYSLELTKQKVEERASIIQASLQMQVCEFKKFPIVSERWLPQFDRVLARYPFLVVNGPSGTGKTYFAKWLLGDPAKVFEVNCASTPEPDLRQFDPLLHDAILFDEAPPSLVSDQRKLFQAPPCWIDLGCSTTNCHKYHVYVSGVKMIVCTNSWHEACQKLKYKTDFEWLQANSIVLDVREPMWLPSEGV